MFKFFKTAVVTFLALTGLAFLAKQYLHIELGNSNFWDYHGLLFLFFISFFPRLTLLFSSVAFGGPIWWLFWLFLPRFLVAGLATLAYWNQNPTLVIIAWVVAVSGESSEKVVLVRRSQIRRPRQNVNRGEVIDITPESSRTTD